mmetsp:Transcript_65349/g.108552  ORF Transcript_65349/g.108552 Transcript_65349/m.108552 type:complete len:203 (-) Transcript_65349:804-1412(-)
MKRSTALSVSCEKKRCRAAAGEVWLLARTSSVTSSTSLAERGISWQRALNALLLKKRSSASKIAAIIAPQIEDASTQTCIEADASPSTATRGKRLVSQGTLIATASGTAAVAACAFTAEAAISCNDRGPRMRARRRPLSSSSICSARGINLGQKLTPRLRKISSRSRSLAKLSVDKCPPASDSPLSRRALMARSASAEASSS